ncbi:hypothetical protein QQ054_01060 [Oscillatoria amoena NRMC-F 0135]|nr:hypothetical protein [Oscillatoria amoena NRMC-F 0135]
MASPTSNYGIYTAGVQGGAQQKKADAVDEFHQNNTNAFMQNLLGGGGGTQGSNNLISNLAGQGGAQLAGAFGIPPEVGNLLGSGIANVVQNLAGSKKQEPRAGVRTPDGWGVKPEFNGVSFMIGKDSYRMYNWGKRPSYWNPSDKTEYVGFIIEKNGKVIAEHAKYVWMENGKLYIQNNLAPWDTNQTGGKVNEWVGTPGVDWKPIGNGTEPQPKHLTGLNNPSVSGASAQTQTQTNITPQAQFDATGVNPNPVVVTLQQPVASPAKPVENSIPETDSKNIVGANPIDWNTIFGRDDKDEEQANDRNDKNQDKDKETNWPLIIGGIVMFIVIVIVLVIALKK